MLSSFTLNSPDWKQTACLHSSLQSWMDALVDAIRSIVDADDPNKKLDEIIEVANFAA